MPTGCTFNGFPKESVEFYRELARNNNKEWFSAHKSRFEEYVMGPARDFVYEMGKRLREIAPDIVADPRVNKSIFRPYRDTRFSKDKSPYKTHLGIFLWTGTLAKMDCPGYYFHLEPPIVMLGVGNHCFSKPLLQMYRDSVVDPILGPALAKAVRSVRKEGDYEIGVKHYKMIPRGYDKEHENAEFLLFSGLTAAHTAEIPTELYSKELLDYAFKRFELMSPIQKWLSRMIGEMSP
ncbi:MAG: DUF2461 domain-containing protein [Desulfomonilaceae bacterium]|nr:DUF2461 domain-containing protein [Desulfomonilaceae bacterium]